MNAEQSEPESVRVDHMRRVNWSLVVSVVGFLVVQGIAGTAFAIRLDDKADIGLRRLDVIERKSDSRFDELQRSVRDLELEVTRLKTRRELSAEWRDTTKGNP